MAAPTGTKAVFAGRDVVIPPLGLEGILRLPKQASGIVLFAHGSGSSRHSPRNNYVAKALSQAGFATLLFDLLTPDEEEDRDKVFDIPLLSQRLISAIDWVAAEPALAALPIGLFGASTGSAAALMAAAERAAKVHAVVSRGGRPDLATTPDKVRAATLLIVGGHDDVVVGLNKEVYAVLNQPKKLLIIPGATHLFPEPGALDAVVDGALSWFRTYLRGD